MNNKLIIQIPVYNEENTIEAAVLALPAKISGISTIETLAINDGSTDKTLEKLNKLNINHTINLSGHCGLGRAFREGLKYACCLNSDIVVNTDGDNQYYAGEIQRLIQPILQKKADMVVGSRQFRSIPRYPRYKLATQLFGNFLVSKLFFQDCSDVTSGFRAMSKECVEFLSKKLTNDYTYTLESLCLLIKYKMRVVFMPVSTNPELRRSRLITSKIFYVKNFFSVLIRQRFF